MSNSNAIQNQVSCTRLGKHQWPISRRESRKQSSRGAQSLRSLKTVDYGTVNEHVKSSFDLMLEREGEMCGDWVLYQNQKIKTGTGFT